MRCSLVSWLTAVTIAFGLSASGPTTASAESVMRLCASQWKEAKAAGTSGDQTWPQFLAQCRASESGAAAAPGPSARLSVGLAVPLVAPVGAGVRRRRAFGGAKRHETMREPMERREGGGNDKRPDLAAVSRAMPCEPLDRRVAFGRFRSGSGAGPRARLSVRLPVPMAEVVGALFRAGVECRLALGPAGGPIHDGARCAGALPGGHCRVGQHVDGRLPLFGDPLLRAHP